MVQGISNGNRKGSKTKKCATLLLKVVLLGNRKEVTALEAKQIPPAGLSLSRRLGLTREAIFYNTLAPKIKISSLRDRTERPEK